jgi:tRNA(Ile)-lysidine synthase
MTLAAALENRAELLGFDADISILRGEPAEILGRILEIEIRAVVGAEAVLRLDRLEAVAGGLHEALVQRAVFAATLGGTALHLDRKTYLSIRREKPRRRGRINKVATS